MGLSYESQKAIIFAQVGQGLEGDDPIDQLIIDKIAPLYDDIWSRWEWKNFYPGLQALYVKRDCIEVLMGQMRDLTDTKLGPNLTNNQSAIFANLTVLLTKTQSEITNWEYKARDSRGPSVGTLSKQSMGPDRAPWQADPASPLYTGNPLAPTPFVSWDL